MKPKLGDMILGHSDLMLNPMRGIFVDTHERYGCLLTTTDVRTKYLHSVRGTKQTEKFRWFFYNRVTRIG